MRLNRSSVRAALVASSLFLFVAPGFATEPEEPKKLLMDTYSAIKGTFSIGEPVADFEPAGQGLLAFRRFANPTDPIHPISMEVQRPGKTTLVFVCVPWMIEDDDVKHPVYEWFRYQRGQSGNIEAVLPPHTHQYPPPDKTPAGIPNTKDWSRGDTYFVQEVIANNVGGYCLEGAAVGTGIAGPIGSLIGLGTGCAMPQFDPNDDPPHWTPIIAAKAKDSPPEITEIFLDMQRSNTQDAGRKLIQSALPKSDEDLSDRATYYWPETRLRGFITWAGWPGVGDFSFDHPVGYIKGDDDEAPTGAMTDPNPHNPTTFAGLDWNMKVHPDPAFHFMLKQGNEDMEVEVEHYVLDLEPLMSKDPTQVGKYYPRPGEWLQATGRWIVDTGHDVFNTEIHPPSLLVTTTLPTPSGCESASCTEVRVMVTGAWTGWGMDFVINPPPRPSATAKLFSKIVSSDRTGDATLEVLKEPYDPTDGPPNQKDALNPNYLYVRVKQNLTNRPKVSGTGMVSMHSSHGMAAVIHCWWVEPVTTANVWLHPAPIPAANAPPPAGAKLFYRSALTENSKWSVVEPDKHGLCLIKNLKPGPYWLRPAASGWNFNRGLNIELKPVSVPVKVDMKIGPWNSFEFEATKDPRPERASKPVAQAAMPVGPSGAQVNPSGPDSGPLVTPEAAFETLTGMLLMVQEDGSPTFGVSGNGLGYRDATNIFVHVTSLIGDDGKPVPSFASAYNPNKLKVNVDPLGKQAWQLVVNGYEGPGVKGAKIRARLLLGPGGVGKYIADEVEGLTDDNGNLQLRLQAGSHFEEAEVAIDVDENPVNPWFAPKMLGRSYVFCPSKHGVDVAPGGRSENLSQIALARAPYRIESVAILNPRDSSVREFLNDVAEREHIARGFRRIPVRQRANWKPKPSINPKGSLPIKIQITP